MIRILNLTLRQDSILKAITILLRIQHNLRVSILNKADHTSHKLLRMQAFSKIANLILSHKRSSNQIMSEIKMIIVTKLINFINSHH